MAQSKVSQNLNEQIEKKGVKGSAICRATGMTYNVLYPCMQGRREYRADELVAICGFIGINPMILLEEG